MPSIDGGHVALTQIATVTVKHDNKPCTLSGKAADGSQVAYTADGTQTAADSGRTYYHRERQIPVGEDWKPTLNDNPRIQLVRGETWFRMDTFSDYIMFETDGIGSIWVALEQMGPWTWSGTATEDHGQWTLSAHQDPDPTLSSTQASGQPQWNGLIPLLPRAAGC
jgi:hypothetical protein